MLFFHQFPSPVPLLTFSMQLCIIVLLRTTAGSWLFPYNRGGTSGHLYPWFPPVPCSPGTSGLSPTYRPQAHAPPLATAWNLSTTPDTFDPWMVKHHFTDPGRTLPGKKVRMQGVHPATDTCMDCHLELMESSEFPPDPRAGSANKLSLWRASHFKCTPETLFYFSFSSAVFSKT